MSNVDGYFQGTSKDDRLSFADVIPETPSSDGESDLLCISNMHCVINEGKEDQLKCYSYKRSYIATAIAWLLMICTGGLMWLIFYWRPDWELSFTHYQCSFNDEVDSVLLIPQDGTNRKFVEKIDKTDSRCMTYAPHLFKSTGFSSQVNSAHPSPNLKSRNEAMHHERKRSNTTSECEIVSQDEFRMRFFHHYDQYIWSNNFKAFVKVEGFDNNVSVNHILSISKKGLTEREQTKHRSLYGANVVEVEIPSYVKLLILEVLNPFYVFQLFACVFWMVDEYVIYATAILVISALSAIVSLITVRRERQSLHDMVQHHNKNRVTVVRRNTDVGCDVHTEDIWTENLVPGDIIVIPPSGTVLSFDAALISGTCIVNESMLTGESIPVTKTPLPSHGGEQLFDVDKCKLHMLYCGTEVIQTRYYRNELVTAIVVRTGFQTSKGKLVHSILFPKPSDLNLLRDSYRFIGVLLGIAMMGFIYTVIVQAKMGESVHDIMFNAIDLITITVPPALPLALTIGIVYAQQRLKQGKIYCISPQRINIAGQVDLIAFDKTGTITEDSLDLTEVVITARKGVDGMKFIPGFTPDNLCDGISVTNDDNVLRCMATCHGLTRIDGKLVGDPLDVKMFEATRWELVEPTVDDESKFDQLQTTYVRPPIPINDDYTLSSEVLENRIPGPSDDSTFNYELGIVRQFQFTSSLQRSSVITRQLKSDNKKEMLIFVKGAPEKIQSLCHEESIPDDFKETLKHYTQNGYRVIGLAHKSMELKWLKAQKIDRMEIEKDLNFLGLLVLHNQLKPNSTAVLQTLHSACIRTLMVTGDNILTAISVARECNIVKQNLPLLIAQTSPPSADYNLIGASSGSPPTLKWEVTEDTVTNDKRSSVLSIEKIVEKTKEFELSMSEIPTCQLAVTGKDYAVIRQHFPEYIKPLATQGAVFARMSPKQKTQLMEDLQDVDYHVCMCGDGANDCGALKAAHVGLSLSDYEASVAAPFTACSEFGVEAMTTLIKEGRAALVTSFGMFKFMALYSLIQFSTVTLLYSDLTNLSDIMYLYIDLIIIDLVAITMSRNHAYNSLYWKKPPNALVSPEVLTSLIAQIVLQFFIQIAALFLVKHQCWFIETPQTAHAAAMENSTNTTTMSPTPTTIPSYENCTALANFVPQPILVDDDPDSYVTTTLFYLSSFMYLSVGVAFSRGHPFRSRIYKNRLFLLCLVFLTVFTLALMFWVPVSWNNFIVLTQIPDKRFLLFICGLAVAHFIISVTFEMGFIENFWIWTAIRNIFSRCTENTMKEYKVISKIMRGELPKTRVDYAISTPWLVREQTLVPNFSKSDELLTRL